MFLSPPSLGTAYHHRSPADSRCRSSSSTARPVPSLLVVLSGHCIEPPGNSAANDGVSPSFPVSPRSARAARLVVPSSIARPSTSTAPRRRLTGQDAAAIGRGRPVRPSGGSAGGRSGRVGPFTCSDCAIVVSWCWSERRSSRAQSAVAVLARERAYSLGRALVYVSVCVRLYRHELT
jgi:hypothetical protein